MSKYKEFGVALKAYRVALNKSLDDVSAAVEIDSDLLSNIEKGNILPEEDILSLIVSHLNLREDEASRLFKLAEYAYTSTTDMIEQIDKEAWASDMPVHYTDMVHVLANKYGVILQFMQGSDRAGKPKVIARVGMSFDHAKSMIDALDIAIERSEEEQG